MQMQKLCEITVLLSFDIDLDSMTLVLKCDQDVFEIEVPRSADLEVITRKEMQPNT